MGILNSPEDRLRKAKSDLVSRLRNYSEAYPKDRDDFTIYAEAANEIDSRDKTIALLRDQNKQLRKTLRAVQQEVSTLTAWVPHSDV